MTGINIFPEPNLTNGWTCPICKTADLKPVTLVSITGTIQDGIAEAEQFHLHCMELVYHKDHRLVGCTWKVT